jgi:protein-tyrosine phosphatase
MGLDYTAGCVNFRDVGEFVNWLTNNKILPVHKLLPGGKTDFVKNTREIGNPKTIINLRKGHDQNDFGVSYYHFPLENKVEKYHTHQKEVRLWLNSIVKLFEKEAFQYPVLIHCLSGKARTGIVIAALLLIIGVSKEIIIQEYLLSEGDVSQELIQIALEGMNQLDYFNRVDIQKVKTNILKE